MTKHHFCLSQPVLAVLILLFAHCAWAENNPKFAWTTQLFLLEQQADSAAGPAMAPDRSIAPAHRSSLIAAPHRVDGTTYISCFIYLQDPTDLSALCDLGVRVIKSFKGLNFITAEVPVDQLEALAEIDNVTSIKVSPVAEPATAVAREKTNVTPLLANTEMAQQRGLNTTYDGSGDCACYHRDCAAAEQLQCDEDGDDYGADDPAWGYHDCDYDENHRKLRW